MTIDEFNAFDRRIDAIAIGGLDAAVAASDLLMSFVDRMFDAIEQEIDPTLLGFGLKPFVGS
jgi:hypothetical protein